MDCGAALRIAFLGPAFPWRGGIAQFAQNLGEKLANQGHEIIMFSFIRQYPSILFPGSDQLDQSVSNSNLASLQILTPYNPVTWFSALHEVCGWSPDVIIASYWLPFMAPAFGYILRRIKHAKIVYLLHNIEFHEKWPLADQLTRYALKPGTTFVTLSSTTARALKALLPGLLNDQILHLFHPVYEPLQVVYDKKESDIPRLLFFGFIKPYKGLDTLLQAVALASRELPELVLTIAGDVYGDKQVYLDQINKLGIQNRVDAHFEFIPVDHIGKYFLNCDVCVLPYRTATQSGVAQMSFAYEVPVIATRVGGIEETVLDGENGFLVPPNDPQALSDKILEYFRGKYEATFRSKIREQNIKYSWDKFAVSLMDRIK
jgi:D-inositol-3-phosphate glycosyltransferase